MKNTKAHRSNVNTSHPRVRREIYHEGLHSPGCTFLDFLSRFLMRKKERERSIRKRRREEGKKEAYFHSGVLFFSPKSLLEFPIINQQPKRQLYREVGARIKNPQGSIKESLIVKPWQFFLHPKVSSKKKKKKNWQMTWIPKNRAEEKLSEKNNADIRPNQI